MPRNPGPNGFPIWAIFVPAAGRGDAMPSRVIIGAQWGDEGKGRVVDIYAESADLVVRSQGGSNAGHTVFVGDKQFALHLIPTGIIRGKRSVMGNGMVVDPDYLLREIAALEAEGITVRDNLLLSENAVLVTPYHKALERASEAALGERKIGTTLQGIGNAYTDKYARTAIRAVDLLEPDTLEQKLRENLEMKNRLLTGVYGVEPLELAPILEGFARAAAAIGPMVADTAVIINRALAAGERVLFEGAQGTMLDIDFGTYPYCTSSSPVAAGACTGSGVSPKWIGKIIGVAKPYTTRVGSGPFPTEVGEDIAGPMRPIGREFGTTTGRARRIGWLDLAVLRKAALLSAPDSWAISHLDVLDRFATIPVCTGYRCDGRILDIFPNSLQVLAKCEPVYEEWPGWQQPTNGARAWSDLPDNARRYLDRIAELTGVPVSMVLVGPRRDETLVLQEPWA